MEGRTPARARIYLAALVVWVAGMLLVIFKYGGHEAVHDAAQAVQLVVMFVAGAAIAWVSFTTDKAQQETDIVSQAAWPEFSPARVFRFGVFLVGGGLPGAFRALRS